ncbi:MAG: hypothetical protein JNK27_05300 [Chitinophagaceae bacterium]|nr:hypothetical protein [Chitinophagaceae bacterium]
MKIAKTIFFASLLILASASWLSCNKSAATNEPAGPYTLSYGDSILYLRPSAGDYIVNPMTTRPGTYSGFPDGMEIDDNTGAINISKSETGLRYRITHTAPDGTITETKVVLSGITFKDHFYFLSNNDSIALPIYNADENRVLPLNGSLFDEGNLANSGGCSVKTDNGKINLRETIRNGVFGFPPRNDAQETFEIKYRINDASGKSENKLKVLLYWYNTINDVPQYVWDILNERTQQGVFLRNGMVNTSASMERLDKAAKPRPPCVVIVDH